MSMGRAYASARTSWPRWWRWTIIALSTLILCSCKAAHRPPAEALHQAPHAAFPPDAAMLPPGAAMPVDPGFSAAGVPAVPGFDRGVPLPHVVMGPWAPPGFGQPWPEEEYLRDGGDRGLEASVQPDWFINGLEPEDAIAHYDTLDGRTVVQPTNRVHVYAPRFGAVRSVTGVVEDQQIVGSRGLDLPTQLVRYDLLETPVSSLQRDQALREVGSNRLNIYRMRMGDGAISQALLPVEFRDRFLPFENLLVIRAGMYEAAEKARLAQSIEAAVAWTDTQGVQVMLDRQMADVAVGDQRAEAVFVVESKGIDKLRVIKVASTNYAEPGDLIDFTIRFDNVGDQLIGNVTIVDNLTNRLEFVPDSAQGSLKGEFLTQPNEVGSLALRWEITDPLKPGDGGVVRFRCRVR